MDEQSEHTSLESPESRPDVTMGPADEGGSGPSEQAAGPPRRPVRASERPRMLLLSALASSVWATGAIFAPLLLLTVAVWFASGRPGGGADVLTLALGVWAAGHGGGFTVAGLATTWTPLLLTVLIAWRVGKAAAATTRNIGGRSTADVRAGAGAVAIVYFALFGLAAWISGLGPFQVDLGPTLLQGGVLIVLSAAVGASTALPHQPWMNLTVWTRRAFRAGMLTVMTLLAVSSLTLGVFFAVRTEQTADIVGHYGDQGWITVLLGLLYLPNMVVWTLAYLVGPGYEVGVNTTVQVSLVEAGPLPGLPVFGAVPTEALPQWASVLMAAPMLASIVWGIMLTYRSPDLKLARVATAAVTAGLWATGGFVLLTWLAAGSLGDGRLASMGGDVGEMALLGGSQVVLGMCGAALLGRLFAVQRQAVRDEVVRADTMVIPEQAEKKPDDID
ncbi:cell division protein PerM [Salininema proteolyticum]|uniref:DUF6350 family protein n=1 Tax=Salininema proteolyticum TaxID=1607685 RepID=A0ABV8TVP3_9ACTN